MPLSVPGRDERMSGPLPPDWNGRVNDAFCQIQAISGEVVLVGVCVGGLLAYDTAARAALGGLRVRRAILIGTPHPSQIPFVNRPSMSQVPIGSIWQAFGIVARSPLHARLLELTAETLRCEAEALLTRARVKDVEAIALPHGRVTVVDRPNEFRQPGGRSAEWSKDFGGYADILMEDQTIDKDGAAVIRLVRRILKERQAG